MAENFGHASDLFKLNERTFAIMGVWPLQSTYAKFTAWMLYQMIHTCAVTADFLMVFGNLDLMILNVTENAWNAMIISKMLIMRFSRTLVDLTKRVIEGVDSKSFENPEEMKMYLSYNRVAMTFFILWVLTGITTSVALHVKPLEVLLRAATIGFLFSLIIHVCGQMSVLAFRIKNINMANHESPKTVFQDIVEKHRNLVEMVDDINKVFSMIIFVEVMVYTVLIGLTAFTVIVNLHNTAKTVMLASICESMEVLLMIYGYCVAGEYLITESQNLYDSYYHCRWYETSESFKKQMIICMIGACKPIQLMGGGFYTFSLANFTGVVKTAAGYISMLRAVV